jgi:hypothetical protein
MVLSRKGQIKSLIDMPIQKQLLHTCLIFSAIFSLQAQNDKLVLGDAVFTPEEVSQGVEVMFMIRFQNLGSDTVLNLVVRDTLDPRFDVSSLRMVDASHDYQLLVEEGNVRWYFPEIRLMANDQGTLESSFSRGYIMYSVQPHRFLQGGQYINNRACINMDDRDYFCTDYATIWIDEGAESDDLVNNYRSYKIIPNPNYGHFSVHKVDRTQPAQIDKVEWWISDMSGKTIWDGTSYDLAGAPDEVMMEKPSPGLYMLWLKENDRLQVERFMVIR